MSTRGPMPRYADGTPRLCVAWPAWRVTWVPAVARWWSLAPGAEYAFDGDFPTHAEALADALRKAAIGDALAALDATLRAPQPQPAQLPATYAEREAQGWEYQHIEGDHWDWRKAPA